MATNNLTSRSKRRFFSRPLKSDGKPVKTILISCHDACFDLTTCNYWRELLVREIWRFSLSSLPRNWKPPNVSEDLMCKVWHVSSSLNPANAWGERLQSCQQILRVLNGYADIQLWWITWQKFDCLVFNKHLEVSVAIFWNNFELLLLIKALDDSFLQKFPISDLRLYVLYPFP